MEWFVLLMSSALSVGYLVGSGYWRTRLRESEDARVFLEQELERCEECLDNKE